jgi:uncharacterized membrane protein HdeD (DUF308 family)
MLFAGFGLVSVSVAKAAGNNAAPQPWRFTSENNQPGIYLYFYWSKQCPHCREALPFVNGLEQQFPWLKIQSRELTEHPENVEEYIAMAAALGKEARSVPAFMWCGNMVVGYDSPDNMGQYLIQELQRCYKWIKAGHQGSKPVPKSVYDNPVLYVPLLGELSLKNYSLPVYTVLLAGADAFNPCAFFVLLFLLSLLVHARNRRRMFLVGGLFVLCSGLMYFLFMAAWLNIFMAIGHIRAITMVAGLVAVVLAAINIKDYFWWGRGVSLSIPQSARPGLFQRARQLANADNLPAMLTATIALALFANTYEFLCTAGFPMVYTRILTMESLPTSTYYMYLVFYNVVYVIPLLVIVMGVALTFGTRKLQVEQGRQLKLLSGVMMLLLGFILLLVPDWLNNVLVAASLIFSALLLSAIIMYWHAAKQRRRYQINRVK